MLPKSFCGISFELEYNTINFNENYTKYMRTQVSSTTGGCDVTAAWASLNCAMWCPLASDINPVWTVNLGRLFYITAIGIGKAVVDFFKVEYSINGEDWVQFYQVIESLKCELFSYKSNMKHNT